MSTTTKAPTPKTTIYEVYNREGKLIRSIEAFRVDLKSSSIGFYDTSLKIIAVVPLTEFIVTKFEEAD